MQRLSLASLARISVPWTSQCLCFIVGGSNLLGEINLTPKLSVNQRKLHDFPIFTVRFLKHCMQQSSSSVLGSLNFISRTASLMTRVKGVNDFSYSTEENRDKWRFGKARTTRGGAQHCGCLISNYLLLERDWQIGQWRYCEFCDKIKNFVRFHIAL